MKKIISLILVFSLLISGCSQSVTTGADFAASTASFEIQSKQNIDKTVDETETNKGTFIPQENEPKNRSDLAAEEVIFDRMDDPELLSYLEDTVYFDLVSDLDSADYFVENIDAIYISQEYLEEVTYNSKENIFFGYSLSELEDLFQDTKYIFTLGEDGTTIVREFEEYVNIYQQIIENVAAGSGVILLCATISFVSGAAGYPAVSMIFAVAADTGTIVALSSAGISGLMAAAANGIETKDLGEALEAGLLEGSREFRCGAFLGALSGGASEAAGLYGATRCGLTMNQAAQIQKESRWPLNAIKNIHSMDEYQIYRKANLIPTKLPDGTLAFLREIDWDLADDKGRTNIQRIADRLAPIDSTGRPYELHHIGQQADSPLAILAYEEHHSKGNYGILHWAKEGKNVAEAEWATQKKEFWDAILKLAQ